MKELDVLLERWLGRHYAGADAGRRRAFQRLLSATDPQLVAWLYRRERPEDPDVAVLVDELVAGAG
jgi:antitoxin CptB